jgi:hypothetical protein
MSAHVEQPQPWKTAQERRELAAARLLSSFELVFDTEDLPLIKSGKGRAPGLPRKNEYWHINRRTGSPYVTPEAHAFRRALRAKAIASGLMDPNALEPAICFGWWRLELLLFARTRLICGDVVTPRIDSDACTSPVKDALHKCTHQPPKPRGQPAPPERGALLDDDGRIVSDETFTAFREGRPGLIIRMIRVRDPQAALRERWPGVAFL